MLFPRLRTLVVVAALALPLLGACQRLVTVTVTEVGGDGRVEVAGRAEALPWTGRFPAGTALTLRALPDPGSTFVGWTRDASGDANPLTVTLSTPLRIGASFAPAPVQDLVAWYLTPNTAVVGGVVGGAAPTPPSTTLRNDGTVAAAFTLVSDRAWLTTAPSAGTLEAGAEVTIDVDVAACATFGSDTATLRAAGGGAEASLTLRRDCSDPGGDPGARLTIDRVYVNQSVPAQDSAQAEDDRIPLVGGRPGLLRVFVTAAAPTTARPIVRLHHRHDGGPESSLVLSGPDPVPTTIDEGILNETFHAHLDAGIVRRGLEAYVVVDLGDGEPHQRFPATGYWTPTVVAVPAANFTIVPISYGGVTPAVSDGSAYLDLTARMFPLVDVSTTIRAPYAFTGDLTVGADWFRLLDEITDLKATDGSDRHYYGIVAPGYSGGIAGIGWIGGGNDYAAAVGWNLLPSGAEVAAHEFGHNWGRDHAPCGVSGEAGYPHAGGLIGVWGYDRGTGTLRSPTEHADIMSYCEPTWTSDYTYEGVLDYRIAAGYRVAAPADVGATQVLLASGRIDHDDVVELDPLFVTEGLATSATGGSYALVAVDVDGREIVRRSFEPVEASHVHLYGFHLALPLTAEEGARLGAVRVERAGRTLLERRAGPAPLSTLRPTVARLPDGGVGITWDRGAYRELLVRHAGGGEVLGRDRSGYLRVEADGRPLELLWSDGLTTVRQFFVD